MKKKCKFCNREFETNNKHRTKCYECLYVYPPRNSAKGQYPFVRINSIIRDEKKGEFKLQNPNKDKPRISKLIDQNLKAVKKSG